MYNNSKVLSLKYRPQIFDDLIGQEVAAQTIYNSIKFNKVPNAYLFTGIRGVGKTTTARIIAKALNCKHGIEKLCKDNFCENCEAIINSNHIDVLEMDAASKTGVDDVRDLIEFSRYGPTTAKYKIFIIDEVHMLSKQAFNALLKTLEEPPEYLKFIFATTEIKKIPVTVVSRCQRFDLSRVKSNDLFKFIKNIKDIEKGNVSDDALKLIVKISEGSVRDALSLLDRALINQSNGKEIDLKTANEIFGYFEKSTLIELFKYLFEGNEEEVIRIYKSIYTTGVEPKVFINDFLEMLYYFKNISSLKLGELSIVTNQSLSIEMFLVRLLYLKDIKKEELQETANREISNIELKNQDKLLLKEDDQNISLNNKTISQIKNISQEESANPKSQLNEIKGKIEIKNFSDLINICDQKKEIKLKYELEANVNLVSFEKQRIEISFNENLDKEFVKELSTKLYEWTNNRWIISFSKEIGMLSKKQIERQKKENLLKDAKKSSVYKKIIELFPDAELIDVEIKKNNE